MKSKIEAEIRQIEEMMQDPQFYGSDKLTVHL
jgi:hypothetical protein